MRLVSWRLHGQDTCTHVWVLLAQHVPIPPCHLCLLSSPTPHPLPPPLTHLSFHSNPFQIKKGGKEEPKTQREENKDLSNVIAKGTIRLPEIEGYPLGPERPAQLNYALENNDAALLLTCYGREGGPIAAKK